MPPPNTTNIDGRRISLQPTRPQVAKGETPIDIWGTVSGGVDHRDPL